MCRTFDSYFCEWSNGNNGNTRSVSGKQVFIDEFSMVPNKFISKLYELWLKYKMLVFMFGDPNQCEPVGGGESAIHHNYLTSVSVREMCPRTVTLKYIKGCSRHDVKTNTAVSFFLENGYISTLKKKDGKSCISRKGLFRGVCESYKNMLLQHQKNKGDQPAFHIRTWC